MNKKAETAGKELETASPRPQLPSTFDDFEQWFDDVLSRAWPFFRRGRSDVEPMFGGKMPKVDVIDRDAEVVVRAEMPGVTKDDLDVSLSDNLLTIRAKTQTEKKEEKGHYYRREMSRGEFQRSIRLPANVEGDKTKATFKHGILELVVPKAAGSKRQTIKVE